MKKIEISFLRKTLEFPSGELKNKKGGMDAGLKNIKAGKRRENITMGLGPGRFGPSSWEEVKVWLHIYILVQMIGRIYIVLNVSLTQIKVWEVWGGGTNINSCPFLIAYNDDFIEILNKLFYHIVL